MSLAMNERRDTVYFFLLPQFSKQIILKIFLAVPF